MAQFMSPIIQKVQDELNKRSQRTKEYTNEKNILDPTNAGNADRGGLYSRSTWIRVVPNTVLTDKKSKKKLDRPILCGGVLYNEGGKEASSGEPITGDLRGGVGRNQQYSERDFTGVYTWCLLLIF